MHLGLWLQNKLSANVDFPYICQNLGNCCYFSLFNRLLV